MSPFLETEAPVAPRARDAGGGASVRRVSAAEGYKLWAPAYDRDPNPLLALEERQLTPLLPDLKQKAVIDVACGTGRWLEKLMDRGARSGFGVDLSRAMLAVARTKTSTARVSWASRAGPSTASSGASIRPGRRISPPTSRPTSSSTRTSTKRSATRRTPSSRCRSTSGNTSAACSS